jgi:hypothetical protein
MSQDMTGHQRGFPVYRLAGSNLLDNRTIFNAGAAARAQIHFDASCPFTNLDFKVARVSFNRFKICICNKLYVQMPADLDQFG